MSLLFSELDVGPVTLPNRIVVPPMCQYSADDGSANDWHLQHLMTMAMSGAGLVVVEATAVERLGRITHGCVGLYSDANEYALGRALAAARSVALPGTKFGVQIAHAGRKASSQRPWEGGNALGDGEDPWQTYAASPLPIGPGWHVPEPLDEAGIARIREAFVQAARRAERIGFDTIELHMAHGYLMHTFLSPIANQRDDDWGGDTDRRMAFPLSVAKAVRDAVGPGIALGARITGSDWSDEGITPEDAVRLVRRLREIGLDYVCVSSGGITTTIRVPVSPGYQVPFAAKVKAETGISTRAVGLIVEPQQANAILAEGKADMVAIGRAMLFDPRWGWRAAEALGANIALPPQYARTAAKAWPGRQILREAAE